MEEGWVKLHRALSNWQWSDKPNMVALLCHFLVMANHSTQKWHGVTVQPGQFITGLHSLSNRTGISVQQLRSCLERLKSTNEITIKSTNQFSIITLLKWEQFQSRRTKSTKQPTRAPTINQQTSNNQSTTNKNVKNDNNEKKLEPPQNKIRMRKALKKLRKDLIEKKIIH